MIGKTISHYRIVEKLGEGGMGVVYKAEDSRLHRSVALKFLRPEAVEDEELRTRFLHEAEAAASLDHPNICTVHEIDEVDGQTFLAMAYVAGESLADRVKKRPLPLEEALDIAVQAAEGLHFAHKKAIVHRDIKSSNIMIDAEGRVKIMDFGLAHPVDGTRITKTGTVLGTPAYMSPEQVQGETVDRRTDIWSLGVVVYEMVSGQLPYRGDSEQAVSHSILYEEPEPLTAVRTRVPLELDRIVGKAMTKAPQERYQHVDEMLVDLRAVLKQLESGKPLAAAAKPRRIARYAGLTALALILMVAGLYLLFRQGVGPPEMPSIAVLPLINLSGDPQQEYFGDAITNAVISELGSIQGLRVVSWTSTRHYKDTAKPVPQIASELNANYLAEGSVMREGDKVRIVSRLIDAVQDRQLQSVEFERSIQNVLALQREVAHAIARQLQIKLTAHEQDRLTAIRPVDPEVYEAYLRGTLHLRTWSPQGLERSAEYFERAIAEDPRFVAPYVGLSRVYRRHAILGNAPGRVMFPKAKALSVQAAQLDDFSAIAHFSLAHDKAFEWDWKGCEDEFRRALELNPNDAEAHHAYANVCLSPQGKLDEALRELHRVLDLDPLSQSIRLSLGYHSVYRSEYSEAIDHFKSALQLDPDYYHARCNLGLAKVLAGQHDEGIELIKTVVDSRGSNLDLGLLGFAYGSAGRREEALEVLRKLEGRAPNSYVSPCAKAAIRVSLGETGRALELLEEAFDDRDGHFHWINVWPEYRPLRSEPVFQALLARMGLSD